MPDSNNNAPARLIYACSGVANTGYLADQIARRFHREGVGTMTCLAAMGARHKRFLNDARSAGQNVLIDGCPISCGKAIFTELDIPYIHFMTTDFDVEKGKTPITEQVIERVKSTIRDLLNSAEKVKSAS